MDTLSEKHQAFVAEYIANKFNATRAYMFVYPDSSEEAAAVSAHHLLRNPNIRAAIDSELDIILSNKREIAAEVVDTWAKIMRETQSENVRMRAAEMLAKYHAGMGTQNERADDKIDELIRKLNEK